MAQPQSQPPGRAWAMDSMKGDGGAACGIHPTTPSVVVPDPAILAHVSWAGTPCFAQSELNPFSSSPSECVRTRSQPFSASVGKAHRQGYQRSPGCAQHPGAVPELRAGGDDSRQLLVVSPGLAEAA